MGKFTNDLTGVTVSVDDTKDGRYEFRNGWTAVDEKPRKAAAKKRPAKKAAAKKAAG